jgi:HK97 family phage major capsid protein
MATAEQELAALEGQVDAELRAAGIEVADESLERKFARLKQAATQRRERAESGRLPDGALEHKIRELATSVQELMAQRRGSRSPLAPSERKLEFAGEADAGIARADAMLELGTPLAPSVDCLVKAPRELASAICDVPATQVKALQRLNDHIFIAATLLQQAGGEGVRGRTFGEVVRSLKMYRRFMDHAWAATELRKAMATSESGAGAEWIPTGFSAELMRRVQLELKVAGLFDDIPMPTSPYKLPVQGGKATAYKAAESVSDIASALTPTTAATANVQFEAVKLAARVLFSDELSEDSVIPILPYVENEVVHALADGVEHCTVNGDTQQTHFDIGYTVAANDVRRCWDGIRRLHNKQTNPASVDLSGTNFTAENLLSLKGEMGKYGANPREGAWVTSIAGYIKLLGLDECLTLDKYGPKAVIFDGELAQLFGSPVVVSEHVAQDLNASGIYDGSTTDRTIVLYVHRPSAKFGRRSSHVESDRIVETQQTQVVAAVRLDFEPMCDAASNNIVGLGHNVATT